MAMPGVITAGRPPPPRRGTRIRPKPRERDGRPPRVRELADEIDREGVSGKVPAMDRQVIGAAGADPDKSRVPRSRRLRTGSGSNGRQGPAGPSIPWASALTAPRTGWEPPMSLELTPDETEAYRILRWAQDAAQAGGRASRAIADLGAAAARRPCRPGRWPRTGRGDHAGTARRFGLAGRDCPSCL